uniref:Homeobox domain-containing protein n=1 Tax=Kalanchoe fedtschenkoi TaxID=63787 RepID=A0A7N0ZUS3_KALFE
MEDSDADSLDGRAEEDKTPVETSRKRKLKTPAQLEALEEYYEDHKYPTDSMRSAIAEKIGLTEKQVSGWFCHRRLKDKRLSKDETLGSGRMERSSGVIQEHFSGPGQDSCGSTKPGEYKNADMRDVESQLLAGQELSPMKLAYHNRMNTGSLDGDMDDTSSESSSPLRPSHLPQRDVPQRWENLRYSIPKGPAVPSNPKVAIGGQFRRPSGYLKIKPKAEHPAITAVKRQLGMNFRVDGPPLGIEFQPPPVDAFQAGPKDTATGPRDGIGSLVPNISGSSYHGAQFRRKMHDGSFKPDHSYLKEEGPRVNHGSELFYSHHQSRPKYSVSDNIKLDHGWGPSPNLDKEYAEEAYGSKRNLFNEEKYGSKGLRIQPISSVPFQPSHNISGVNPMIAQRSKYLKNKLSDTKSRQREPRDTFERRMYAREPEIEKHHSVSSNTSERPNLIPVTATPEYKLMDKQLVAARNDPVEYPNPNSEQIGVYNNELKDKKARFGYSQPDFGKTMSLAINRGKGAAGAIPSSFSEDETGETSSSGDDE